MASIKKRGTKDKPQWYMRFVDVDGKRKNRPTHQTSKEGARRFAAEVEARVARGEPGFPDKKKQDAKTITVRQLAERFFAEYNPPRLRNRERYISTARYSCNSRLFTFPIANLRAASVKRLDVEIFRDALRLRYRDSTVNLTLAFLARIFSWAIDGELLDCRNPCGVERMRAKPSEECYTREQVERLLAPEHLDPMIATLLYTGLRRGELAGLTWDVVRLDTDQIEVRRSFTGPTKNGKARHVPIHRELKPILMAWKALCPASPEGLLFPIQVRGCWKMRTPRSFQQVRAALKAAGCPHDHARFMHAARRTFATLLAASGGSRDAIEQLLGHTSSGNRVTAIYILPSIDHLARELAKMTLQPARPATVLSLDAYRQQAV